MSEHPTIILVTLIFVVSSLGASVGTPNLTPLRVVHSPILINSDADFTLEHGVVGGNGTAANPYVIAGWEIDASNQTGIEVRSTRAYFVIRDVYVHSSQLNGLTGGIEFVNAMNGEIDNSSLLRNGFGVTLQNSGNIVISWGNVSSNVDGIVAASSQKVTVTNSTISHNSFGFIISGSNQVSIVRNRVFSNYGWGYGSGIRLQDASNTTIRENVLSNNQQGIDFDLTVSNVEISDNLIEGNLNNGVVGAAHIRNVTVARNNVSGNGAFGIYLYGNDLRISKNYVSLNGGDGITIAYADRGTIDNNSVIWSAGYGISLYFAVNTSVRGNSLTENGLYLYGESMLQYSSHSISQDNRINGLPIYYYASCSHLDMENVTTHELIVANCASVKIANMTIRPMEIGILMAYVRGVAITSSQVTGSYGWGMELMDAADLLVAGNNASSNGRSGVVIGPSTNVTLSRNEFSWNQELGLVLTADNGTIQNNSVIGNGGGISASGPNLTVTDNNISRNGIGASLSGVYSKVVGNVIAENRDYGLYLEGSDHQTYHNNFMANGYQAEDYANPRSVWDNGFPAGGNYWSDYVGQDNCTGPLQTSCGFPDGIGDTPYFIRGGGQDRYPLMHPYNTSNTAPVASFQLSVPNVTSSLNLSVDASPSWDKEDSINRIEVRWDWESDGTWDTDWTFVKTASHTFPRSGTYAIRLEVRDSGNATDDAERTLTIDTSPPETTAVVEGTKGTNGWFVSAVSVTLHSADNQTGVSSMDFRIDSGSWQFYKGSFTIGDDGLHILEFQATDAAGNEEATKSVALKIDTTPPVFLSVSPNGIVRQANLFVNWSATDAASGVERFELSVDGGTFFLVGNVTGYPLTIADGDHTIEVKAFDSAGNAAVVTFSFRVDTSAFNPSSRYGEILMYAGLATLVAAISWFSRRWFRSRSRPPP